jgi:hypothetical protein
MAYKITFQKVGAYFYNVQCKKFYTFYTVFINGEETEMFINDNQYKKIIRKDKI